MEKNEMSMKDVLEMAVREINGIMVPVEYADQIARPLCGAVCLIRSCIEAIDKKPEQEGEENVQGES